MHENKFIREICHQFKISENNSVRYFQSEAGSVYFQSQNYTWYSIQHSIPMQKYIVYASYILSYAFLRPKIPTFYELR